MVLQWPEMLVYFDKWMSKWQLTCIVQRFCLKCCRSGRGVHAGVNDAAVEEVSGDATVPAAGALPHDSPHGESISRCTVKASMSINTDSLCRRFVLAIFTLRGQKVLALLLRPGRIKL